MSTRERLQRDRASPLERDEMKWNFESGSYKTPTTTSFAILDSGLDSDSVHIEDKHREMAESRDMGLSVLRGMDLWVLSWLLAFGA